MATPGNKLARNIVANYLGQGWAALMAIAFLPIYIDHLGIEAYGLIGFFSVMQSLLAIFDLGVTPTLTREMARYSAGKHSTQSIHDLLRSFEYVFYTVAVIMVSVVWMTADYLASEWIQADQLPAEAVLHSVVIMAAVFASRFLEGIYRGTLIGLERQVLYNALNAVMATARYAGAIWVLQYPTATIETFFVWQALMSLLTLAVLVAATQSSLPRTNESGHFSMQLLGSVMKFSAGMTAVSGLSMVMINVDKLMLSRLLPLNQFGHYALASVAASVLYMAVIPITQAAYPRMVGLVANTEFANLLKSYQGTNQIVATIVGPAAFCLAFFSQEIIYVWSGNLNLAENTAQILTLLALAAFANCLGHLSYNLQLAHGKTKTLIIANAVAVAFAIALLPWAAAEYGLIGAGYAWLAVASTHAVTSILISHAQFLPTTAWHLLWRDILLPLAGGFAIVAFTYLFRPGIGIGRLEWGFILLIISIVSIIASALLAPRIRSALKIHFTRCESHSC